MNRYSFVLSIFLVGIIANSSHGSEGELNFWRCVEGNASNTRQLLGELESQKESPLAQDFCKCFKEGGGRIEDRRLEKARLESIIEAGEYVAGVLYKEATNAEWGDADNLRKLKDALRFCRGEDVGRGGLGFQAGRSQSTGDFLKNRIFSMLKFQTDFADAGEGIEIIE